LYYTFRQTGPMTYEVTKWEDNRSYPLDTYVIEWRKGILSAHMCDCPARIPCRHLKMLKEAIDTGKMDEAWTWVYDDNGWTAVVDQTICIYRELIEV
jgi:predicted nucleic acid-binding Zn finger protein